MNVQQEDYTVFIAGEDIDLCVPNELAIERDGWWNWLNDPSTTRYLDHGIFPNTIEQQKEFLRSLDRRDRLALLIKPKDTPNVIGTISLSEIDFVRRSAAISIVIGKQTSQRNLYSLEAMALVTKHGFEQMGLLRISAGQAYPELSTWNKWLELLGYRAEGILRSKFVKGHTRKSVIALSCLYEDYQTVLNTRGGEYWLGKKNMFQLIKKLPKKGFADLLDTAIDDLAKSYFESLNMV